MLTCSFDQAGLLAPDVWAVVSMHFLPLALLPVLRAAHINRLELRYGTLGRLMLELDLSTREDVHVSVRPVDSLGSPWDGRVLLCP